MGQFDDIARSIKETHSKINRAALISVSTQIIQRTPVDTAMAKSSWQFGIGTEPDGIVTSTTDSVGAMKVTVSPMKVGERGYFINGQPYIIPLEFGWSAQAPRGMLRISVANWQKFVDRATRAVK